MNRTFLALTSAAFVLSTVAVARDARALGPVDLEAAAKVGYATNPSSVSGGTNPMGLGLGARAGLAFLGGIYLGGNIQYYLGGSENVPTSTTTNTGGNGGTSSVGSYSLSVNTLMYGGELGYGLKILDLLTIRPQVGLGNATFSASADGNSTSTSNWYLEPGVTAFVTLGPLLLGADANALFFPGLANSQAAFALDAQVGIKL